MVNDGNDGEEALVFQTITHNAIIDSLTTSVIPAEESGISASDILVLKWLQESVKSIISKKQKKVIFSIFIPGPSKDLYI